MKTALLILILIHGLIHVMGFVKGFELLEVKQLAQPISRYFGILWLLGFILLMVAAFYLFSNNNYYWIIAFAAVILSQILIINFWKDAKFGTIANIIILISVVLAFSKIGFYKRYQTDVNAALNSPPYFDNSLLTVVDIQHLPEPIKKYLNYTGAIGKPKANNFRIVMKGKLRKNEQSEWMSFKSEQHNFMHNPTRLFFMNAVMKQLPVAGYHCFKNGDAFMDIRLFSIFKVQYQEGADMDKAETVTFFNDMCCMAPATLIDNRIVWQDKGNNVVQATFTNNGISISANLNFNETGELVNFISNDRYNVDAGKKMPWSTPLSNYRTKDNLTLAKYAETINTYPDRDMVYGKFEIESVSYNCKEFY